MQFHCSVTDDGGNDAASPAASRSLTKYGRNIIKCVVVCVLKDVVLCCDVLTVLNAGVVCFVVCFVCCVLFVMMKRCCE